MLFMCRYRGEVACGETSLPEASNIIQLIFSSVLFMCRYRAEIANGKTSQPEASNMMQLRWDDGLAKAAQEFVEESGKQK